MNDESQLQVRPNSALRLSTARSGLIARGRRDAALLAPRCNKCGDAKELVFAGCVCDCCSAALDEQWAGSTATAWLLTRYRAPDPDRLLHMWEFVLVDTTYAQMKTYWASDDPDTQIPGFYRSRQPTSQESGLQKSEWGTRSNPSRGSTIRPATLEEVAAYQKSHREWSVIGEVARIFDHTCDKLGILEADDSERIEEAAQEIVGKLRQLGWLEELARLNRENSEALCQIDGTLLFELVFKSATEDLRN